MMRIGMIAPLEMRVPPAAYGGTELVVSLLTEELVRRGHDVTLFASGDSVTGARLVPGCPTFLRGSDRDRSILTMLNVVSCLERAQDFDVIHNHTCFEGLAVAGLTSTPVLTTLHGGLSGDWLLLFERYRGWYNTISHSARSLLPASDNFAGVIYNAVDAETYPFNPCGRGDHLLFLSRMSPEKGPHIAIEVAQRLGKRLLLAGNVDRVDEAYFQEQVLPQVDGARIVYVGEVDQAQKRCLLSEAACLLAPITWDEPFGLFMAEAMACGTPVIAFARGAAPEIISPGETGFVVPDVDAMAEAVGWIGEISPYACRLRVEQHFSVQRMTDGYLAAYEQIIAGAPMPLPVEHEVGLSHAAVNGAVVLANPFSSTPAGEALLDGSSVPRGL